MKIKALDTVDRVFVTCSMTPPSAAIDASELARAHRRQGYSEIAVHYVICRDGTVETGRAESVRGAIAPTHSDTSLQVCLVGGLNDALEPKGTFTSAQVDALIAMGQHRGVPLVFGHEAPLKALKDSLKDS